MRALYSLLWYFALPFALLRLRWRARIEPEYAQHIGERLGFIAPPPPGAIWLHAVSVGETVAAAPLVHALLAAFPDRGLLLTTTTPAGAARARALFGERVQHRYLAYDLPGATRRFLVHSRPCIGILMETELWPNLIHAAGKKKIPLLLANARLSARSAHGYARVRRLVAPALQALSAILAQDAAAAARFIALGAAPARVAVAGNMKFDLDPPPQLAAQARELRAALGAGRPCWIAASTHPGEHEVCLAAHAQIRRYWPDALLILVPRHPAQFTPAAQQARAHDWPVALRSTGAMPDCAVFIGDSMGELLLFYACADVAFIGGSLIAHGGHNPLEPAALALPIVHGPHVFNFSGIYAGLAAVDGTLCVADPAALTMQLRTLLADPRRREAMGRHAQALQQQGRGAVQHHLEAIRAVLDAPVQ